LGCLVCTGVLEVPQPVRQAMKITTSACVFIAVCQRAKMNPSSTSSSASRNITHSPW
jgi:hypothetical protein